MAKVEITSLVDDLDGGVADETVRFSVDGSSYEIDLSAEHAAAMRALLAPYVTAGRRLARNGRPYHRIDLDAEPPRRRRR